MAQGDVAGGSSTSGPGPISEREWRMAAGRAACVLAPICANCWAMPGDARSLGLILAGRVQVVDPVMGALLSYLDVTDKKSAKVVA